jgi:hypothetical protein
MLISILLLPASKMLLYLVQIFGKLGISLDAPNQFDCHLRVQT